MNMSSRSLKIVHITLNVYAHITSLIELENIAFIENTHVDINVVIINNALVTSLARK